MNIQTINVSRALTLLVLSIVAALSVVLLPTLTLAAVETTDGFVCPVISTDAVLNSPKGAAIGEGHYTILGPNVHVPVHATNDNGEGSPGGPHAAPGDEGYTAIWATP